MTGKFTYSNSALSYATASESLLATLTPPIKYTHNQIVDCNNTVYKLVLALHLADPLPCL